MRSINKMKLKTLNLLNYKSIKECCLDFNNKSIILGANASGKSNLISSLKFINYILMYGIDDAVSLMGGIDNLMNINTIDDYLQIGFSLVLDNKDWYRKFDKNYDFNPIQMDYMFRLTKKKNNQFKVIFDEIKLIFSLYENNKKREKNGEFKQGEFSMLFTRDGRKFSANIIDNKTLFNEKDLMNEEIYKLFSYIMKESKKELMLNHARYILPPIYFKNNELFKIYDFDPKLLKTPSQITSKRNLEEDGSNIGVVLETLLKDRNNKNKLFNLLKSCLPNIQSVEIKKNIDKSVAYQMKESYFNKPLYSQFLSDGTVSMLALVISLYFNDEDNIIILEEPERNLHPKVIRKLVEMLNEVSKDKQIIITTHNAEIVRNSNLEDIVCIKREKDGTTVINKPMDNERVKMFLQNELGLDDLFLDGII